MVIRANIPIINLNARPISNISPVSEGGKNYNPRFALPPNTAGTFATNGNSRGKEFTAQELEVIKSDPFLAARIEAAGNAMMIINHIDTYKNSVAHADARQAYNFYLADKKEFYKTEFPAWVQSSGRTGDQQSVEKLIKNLVDFGETKESITKLYEASFNDKPNIYGRVIEGAYVETDREQYNRSQAGIKSKSPFSGIPIIGTVFEAVGSVANIVIQGVEKVGKLIDDYVIQPILDDPVSFAIQVAAAYFGIPPPVTAGTITAAKGGDIEDIGKSALAAYVAPKVGSYVAGQVASAATGSALQNTLASAAGGAASGVTSAAITGGDVGASAILGAAGSAGASVGREIAAGMEYDVPVFSDQSAALISQDAPINPFSSIGADVGTALARSIVTGDVEGEIASALKSVGIRETGELLRSAFASSQETDEAKQAEQSISAELEANPNFAEEIQLAQIAAGDLLLTTSEKIDVLAESIARDAFSAAVDGGVEVSALPALAIPFAANAAVTAARTAAPALIQRISQFAANDPRFAQVMITNPYTQQLLAAAGLTMSVSLTGDVSVETIQYTNQSAAETARLNRYASEIVKTVPNASTENVRKLEQNARESEAPAQREAASEEQAAQRETLVQRQADLRQLSNQGFPVQRELERVELALRQPIPMIDVTGDASRPGSLPPPTIDIRADAVARPGTAPEFDVGTAPEIDIGTAPEVTPRPGEELAPESQPVPRPDEGLLPDARPAPRPSARPVQRLQPQPKTPSQPGSPPRPPVIESLFTDQDILDLVREGLGEDFVKDTLGAVDLDSPDFEEVPETDDAADGATRPVVDIRGARVGRDREGTQSSISGRAVGPSATAITGMKEPTFGGELGKQEEVWNVRSLRLRKALGI